MSASVNMYVVSSYVCVREGLVRQKTGREKKGKKGLSA